MSSPTIPKGTRDFSPAEMARRNYLFDTIRSVFALYGFAEIATPAMETLGTLMGKYGAEGDKLLYKVLNSGDFRQGLSADAFSSASTNALAAMLCEKGLRYDLTVPFARYVVQHRDSVTLPFKRYQMQPVWRADRPQKGRYREFYQCDADIVGSSSLLNEVELLSLLDTVFCRLGIAVVIKVNSRKLLAGIAESLGAAELLVPLTVALDKIDKIGEEAVVEELHANGLSSSQTAALQPLFHLSGSNDEQLATLAPLVEMSPLGRAGLAEIETILAGAVPCALHNEVRFACTLARGLNYYTGAILEVAARDVAIGSISGGGRYDNLTGIFGMDGLSGVGISFGADRIYDVLTQLDLFPATVAHGPQLLFVNFGAAEVAYCLPLLRAVRAAGISGEIYPDAVKMKKQLAYANAKGIPFVALAGEDECQRGVVTVKDMTTGAQATVPSSSLAEWVLSSLKKER